MVTTPRRGRRRHSASHWGISTFAPANYWPSFPTAAVSIADGSDLSSPGTGTADGTDLLSGNGILAHLNASDIYAERIGLILNNEMHTRSRFSRLEIDNGVDRYSYFDIPEPAYFEVEDELEDDVDEQTGDSDDSAELTLPKATTLARARIEEKNNRDSKRQAQQSIERVAAAAPGKSADTEKAEEKEEELLPATFRWVHIDIV